MVNLNPFKTLKCNEAKLSLYGFEREKDFFILKKNILNDDFLFVVKIQHGEIVCVDVFDNETNEPFSMFYVKEATGAFVGSINNECEKFLEDLRQKCFFRDAFKTRQAKAVISHIEKEHDSHLEFLWKDYPRDAIFRRKDNKKWYGIIMAISKRKLGFDSDEEVEIVDLKADFNEPSLVDNKLFFPGFHMNKKHWITIVLDGSVPTTKILELVDKSFLLAKK